MTKTRRILLMVLLVFSFGAKIALTQSSESFIVIVWSTDNTRVAYSDEVGTITIRNVATGQVIGPVFAHSRGVIALAWRPQSDEFASVGGDGLVKIWNGADLTLIRQFAATVPGGAAITVDWNSAGDKLAVGTFTGTVIVFDVNGTMLFSETDQSPTPVHVVRWISNSHLMKIGGDSGLVVWDTISDQSTSSIVALHSVIAADVNPLGDRVALVDSVYDSAGGQFGSLEVWSLQTGQMLYAQFVPNKEFLSLDWGPDGSRIATSSENGIDIWNAADGALIESLEVGHEIWSIAWDSTGSNLAYGGVTGTLQVAPAPGSPTATFTPTATLTLTPTPTVTPVGTTYITQIGSTGSDQNENGTTWESGRTTIWIGNAGSLAGSWTGLRFKTNVPRNATILAATLRVYSSAASSTAFSARVWGDAEDNPTFFGPSDRPSGRPRTAASVLINNYTPAWNADTWYDVVDLAPIVQEIVNRPGWAPNNFLALLIQGTGTLETRRYFKAYEAGASTAAQLVITYVTSATPTPTRTPTPTVTFTPSPTPVGGFPANAVLDNFNRANGPLGTTDWSGSVSGFSILSNRLDVGPDGDIYWNTVFGANQEAYVTLTSIDPNAAEIDLILKQQGSTWQDGSLEIWYQPSTNRVQVWTFDPANSWTQYGGDIPVTFAAGDRFGARARFNGLVEVYRNSTLLGSVSILNWQFCASGGRIGLWMIEAPNTVLDDFGGGNF